ncbi:MAG: hypothetical protein WCV92_01585 [Candidatus Buchananbacteria bacterium]
MIEFIKQRANGRGSCYGNELSACQFEEKFDEPCDLGRIEAKFAENEREIQAAERALGFGRVFVPAAPLDMPLNIYPDERYLRITRDMPMEVVRAACRVAGVHVHIGMPDHDSALRVYNEAVRHFDELCELGSTEERLREYRRAAKGMSTRMELFRDHLMTSFVPPSYPGWAEFHARAVKDGFADDPRRLWDFIRISKHGTIEFRMFDTTRDVSLIVSWARFVHEICARAV